ncbi:MOSC domain-containing protein [Lujinxingia sediminis]|uniref:MOSC domain-containing protein n=1 Tax=Lujinxingia sediminis TaxID=2480984 RepID=A0ABY0CXD9_9DELT|nr:MOSC domain-containing protein [Lujinxingia sediminis]RVU48552.1 MOSC domain-containing protein [Lujinxingia sediminis]
MSDPWQGTLYQIWICAERGGVPATVTQAEAVASTGLRGDRYFSPSLQRDPARQVTLISAEVLTEVAKEQNIDLRDGRHRRQLVVQGAPLNDLVGHEFVIGEVRLRGIELCEPCRRMARLSGEKGAIKAFVHRGGLNAEILIGGILRPGDTILPVPPMQGRLPL